MLTRKPDVIIYQVLCTFCIKKNKDKKLSALYSSQAKKQAR